MIGVTGAAGFLGGHLVDALLRKDEDVVAVDKRESEILNTLATTYPDKLTIVKADLLEDTDVLDGSQVVYHMAGIPGVRQSWDYFNTYLRANVSISKSIFSRCAQHGIRVVYASSSSVYGDADVLPTPEDAPLRPISPYGLSKVMQEQMAEFYERTENLDAAGVRYFTVYGPRQRPDMALRKMCECAARNRTFTIYGDGNQKRDFTHVADAIDATILIAEKGRSPIYNVGSGDPKEILQTVSDMRHVNNSAFPYHLSDPMRGDVKDTHADISRITRELRWSPTIPWRRGLRAMFESVEEELLASSASS